MAGSALSNSTYEVLVDALASESAAAELQSKIQARSIANISPDLQRRIIDGLGSSKAGNEFIAAIASGAQLSLPTSKRVIIMMAGDATQAGGLNAAGNELINFVQTTANAKNIPI
jgi:hypothetical protein